MFAEHQVIKTIKPVYRIYLDKIYKGSTLMFKTTIFALITSAFSY